MTMIDGPKIEPLFRLEFTNTTSPGIMTYIRDRLFEWVMTLTMLGMAVEIAIWPKAVEASSFRLMLNVISPLNIGVFFMGFGLLRTTALIANGSWPEHGPRLRAMGAGAAALMWGQMCVALIMLLPQNNDIPSPGIALYFFLTVGELISAYRATSDARHRA